MPPKKRKQRDATSEQKGAAVAYLEECHAFGDEQLTRDFNLTHGNVWYYLATHHFDVDGFTLLLLPLYTDATDRETKGFLYRHIAALSKKFKDSRRRNTEKQCSDFKKGCDESFRCPPRVFASSLTTSHVTSSTSSEPIHSTPTKVQGTSMSALLCTPAKTRNQQEIDMARNARVALYQKDKEQKLWKSKYKVLYNASKYVRTLKEKLTRRNEKIKRLNLKLSRSAREFRNQRRRIKYLRDTTNCARKAIPKEDRSLRIQLAEAENTTMELEEEVADLRSQNVTQTFVTCEGSKC